MAGDGPAWVAAGRSGPCRARLTHVFGEIKRDELHMENGAAYVRGLYFVIEGR